MSDAAVNIFADLRLRRQQLMADLQAAKADIQKVLSNVNTGQGGNVTVKVKLDEADIKRQFAEIMGRLQATVRITLGPGAMGGPGNAPSGGGSADSPGGGGATSNYQRGLARYVGAGFLLNEGFRGADAYLDYKSAIQRANILNDQRGKLQAEQDLQNTIGSIPLVGRAAKFGADLIGDRRGTDRIMAEADANDRKTGALQGLDRAASAVRSQTRSIGQTDAAKAEAAVAAEYKQLQAQISEATKGLAPKETAKARKAVDDAFGDYARAMRREIEERRDRQNRSLFLRGTAADQALSGKTDAAALTQMEAGHEAEYSAYKDKYGRAAADKLKSQVLDPEYRKAQQEQGKQRELETAQTEDKITDIRSTAAEARARALGRHFEAEKQAFFRTQDEMVRKAEESYRRETDAAEKANKKRVLEATRVAAQINKESYGINRERESDRAAGAIEENADVMNTRARGQNTRADRDAINRKYQREIKDLQDAGDEKGANAKIAEYGAALAQNDRDEARQRRRIQHGTTAANAEASGQEGVGAAFALQDELSDLQKDAAGDPDRQQEVRRYGKARVDAMRRNMGVTRGRRGSYNDFMSDVQDAVLNQAKYGQANKMLDNVNSALAYNKPLDDANPDADRAMAQAARDISKAVDGKSLYVLRD